MGGSGSLGEMGTQGWGDGDKNKIMGKGIMGGGDQEKLETEMGKMEIEMGCWRQD